VVVSKGEARSETGGAQALLQFLIMDEREWKKRERRRKRKRRGRGKGRIDE
jgi:hypothetical protein